MKEKLGKKKAPAKESRLNNTTAEGEWAVGKKGKKEGDLKISWRATQYSVFEKLIR